MADEPEHLVLVYPRRIDANVQDLRAEVTELKTRRAQTTRAVVGSRRERLGDAETVAHL